MTAIADLDVVRATLLRVKRALLAGPVTDEVLLGIEREIRREFGGEARYIAAGLPKPVRDEMIRRDLAEGMPQRAAARRHDVALRTVQRVASVSRETDGMELSSDDGENSLKP